MRHSFFFVLYITAITGLLGCGGTRNSFDPRQKFSPEELKEDFDIGWTTYQKNHPSLYWYTTKDSVDRKFAKVRASLTDSLTESEFRLRLSYAVAAIRCGHTSVLPSKGYRKYAQKAKEPSFPLQVKVWGSDSMVVLNNLLGDTLPIKRGTIVTAIDQIPASVFINQMKQYAYTDGFSDGFKELQISSGFPARFKWLYGLKNQYNISYMDSAGNKVDTLLAMFDPAKSDSLRKIKRDSLPEKPVVAKKPQKKTDLWQIRYRQFRPFCPDGTKQFQP